MNENAPLSAPFHHWKARLYVGLTMLLLSFLGLIITEVKQDGAWYYWRALCVVFAFLSMGLHFFLRKKESVSYIGTVWHEIFHWLGLLLSVTALSIMVDVGIFGRFLSSIAVVMLLALATYLAGVYMEVTLIFVGLMLGLFALGLSIVSAYLYPIVIPLAILGAVALWIYLKRKHIHHQKKGISMNISALWDSFALWAMHFGMPLVHCYHMLCGNAFYNVATEDAEGLEKVADTVLVPMQYLFAGHKAVHAILEKNGSPIAVYKLEQRFDYRDEHMWHKTALSYAALPASLALGSVLKGLSYLSSDTRRRYEKIVSAKKNEYVSLHNNYYTSVGITPVDITSAEKINPSYHKRRPGEENILQIEKEALRQVVKALTDNKIMFWVDCGTCLGTYRYGGIIPWDWDIDLAILQNDFDNVKNTLTSALDPNEFVIQDWSSRDKPKTYLKVYVKATGTLIDIYHFAIDEKNKSIYSILSNGDCVFLPQSWKIRERRFTIPTSFDIVFPLKKATFDGVEVFVPAKTKEYLQQRYGDNIEPAKIYNEKTGQYEKDLSHPYWQRAYVQ